MKIQQLTLILFICQQTMAQNLSFEKHFFPGGYSDARGVVACNDGGFLVTGLDKTGDDPTGDLYAVKLAPDGNIVWKKNFGLPHEDGGNGILACRNGDFLITGHTNNTSDIECDEYFVRISDNGEIVWKYQIGEVLDDVASFAVEAENGYIYAVGRTENYHADHMDMLLTCLRPDGSVVFQKAIGTSLQDYAYSLDLTPDGNIVIGGYSQVNFNAGTEDIYIVKCTMTGEEIWETAISNPGTDKIHRIICENDGTIMAFGCESTLDKDKEAMIVCLSPEGNILWKNQYGGLNADQFYAAEKDPGGGWLCTGITQSYGDEAGDTFVAFINQSGDLISLRFFGTEGEDQARCIAICEDGSYIIAGRSQQEMPDHFQASMIKTDDSGAVSTVKTAAQLAIIIYPNPFTEEVHFLIPDDTSPKRIEVYTLDGKLLFQASFSTSFFTIEKAFLGEGILIYRILNDKGEVTNTGRIVSE